MIEIVSVLEFYWEIWLLNVKVKSQFLQKKVTSC